VDNKQRQENLAQKMPLNNCKNDTLHDQKEHDSRLTSRDVTQSDQTNQSTTRYRNRQSAEKLLTKIIKAAQEAATANKTNDENPRPVESKHNATEEEETVLFKGNKRIHAMNSLQHDSNYSGDNDGDVSTATTSKHKNLQFRTKVCLTPKITVENDIDGYCCLQPHRRYSISFPVDSKENGAIPHNTPCSHYHRKHK
jgi:hypothetical protein